MIRAIGYLKSQIGDRLIMGFIDTLRKEYNRRENKAKKALYQQGVSKTDLLLEVGPSHNPLFPKKDGWNVEIIDRLDQEGLKEFYKLHGVDLDAIEYVDYIWKGGSYVESVQKKNVYDYVIASHVIEHTTNLVGFLNDCSELLKENGRLRLVVPDRRYTFDHFRVVTDIGEVLNNYYNNDTLNSPGIVAEYVTSIVSHKGLIIWKKRRIPFIGWIANKRKDTDLARYTFCHSEDVALDWSGSVLKDGEYKDVHHYVFTAGSFEYLIYELRQLGLIDLEIEQVVTKYGNEFMVTLRKCSEPPVRDDKKKMKLLLKRNREFRI